jgi:predicted nucleotidyltransferase
MATFLDELKKQLGPDLVQVWLFGSQARGDAVAGSDYDILVIAKGERSMLKAAVREAEWACMEKHNALVACIIYTPDIWSQALHSPLGINVLREGHVVA